ncbi:hypothetical protein AN220_29715, partial [Streptomyces nanshensis]
MGRAVAVGGRPPVRFVRPADPAPEGGHQPGIVHGVLGAFCALRAFCAFCAFCGPGLPGLPGTRAGRRGVPQFGHEVLL